MNIFFTFCIMIGVMLLAGDIASRGTPALHHRYRAFLAFFRRQLALLIRWVWRHYHREIVGAGIAVLVLALTDHLK